MRTWLIVLLAGASGCIVTVSNPCLDGLQDGTESDVDCGGACGPCADGRACLANSDCQNGSCLVVQGARICRVQPAPTCSDQLRNGNESDVDCGGGTCPACGINGICVFDADCSSGVCSTSHICLAPSCTDQVQNGDETGVDCGGSCPPCGHLTGSPLTSTPSDTTPAPPLYFIKSGAAVGLPAGMPLIGIAGATGTATGGPGSSWTVTWIGDQSASNQFHTFYGSVWTQGAFMSITPGCPGNVCTLEGDDLLSQPGAVGGGWTRIDFDSNFSSGSTPEGFQFVVVPTNAPMNTNHEPVCFDLYIDGVAVTPTTYIVYPDRNSGALVNPGGSFFCLVNG